MLGFAALVEKEGEELNELNPIFTGVELYSPSPADSLLGYRFINFHRWLNQARVRLQGNWRRDRNRVFRLGFLPDRQLENAIQVARSLMFELVASEVPARMGIARGSYRMLRFLTDSSASIEHGLHEFRHAYIAPAREAVEVNGHRLAVRDGIAAIDERCITVLARENSEVILVETV